MKILGKSIRVSKETVLVIFLGLIVAVLASPKLSLQILHVPKDHVFIGMTTYFEDFYYYLDQFYQGKTGNLLTENRFSVERFAPTLVYINHLILGRIGGWFGWESFQSYNFFGFFFKCIFILIGYLPIRYVFPGSARKRISAYLVFLFSTSLPNISWNGSAWVFNGAYDVFRAENRVLARFGTAPNGMLINITFIGALIVLSRLVSYLVPDKRHVGKGKIFAYSAVFVILLAYLTLTDAAKASVLLGYTVLIYLFEVRKHMPRVMEKWADWLLIVSGCVFMAISAYIFRTVDSDPVYSAANAWDVEQFLFQVQHDLRGIFFGFGLQVPFAAIGYWFLCKKRQRTFPETAVLYLVGIVTSLYVGPMILRIPIPAFRFLFPAVYPFIAALVIYGAEDIGRRVGERSWLPEVVLSVYLAANIVTFLLVWRQEVRIPEEPDYHFTYMPKEFYDGLVFLRTAEPRDGNVLASPYTSTDLMIPGLTGRYSYTGHMLTTYHNDQKDDVANKFFFDWKDTPETRAFLTKNNIRLIVVSWYEALLPRFEKEYGSMLKPVFQNSMITIFRYDPQ